MLQRQGYEVRAANSGVQALAMVQNDLPDLILLDVMMPEMDGYEVARRLRTDARTADIPIIMFTAKSQVDDKVAGFEAGADDYLTKPTQPRELFAHMRAVLARSTKTRQTAPPPAAPGERGMMVGITSSKGGLGTSTLATNLAIVLHDMYRKEVILADFRPGMGTIGLELGYLKSEGLGRLLQRKPGEITPREVESELLSHNSGVRLLLSSHRAGEARHTAQVANFETVARILPSIGRFVVLDLPPAIDPINVKIMPLCDQIIIIVEPSPHTITQTKSMLEEMINMGIGEGRIDLVLVNRVRSGVQLSWSQVQEQIGKNITVIFTPAPELAYQASVHNVPIAIQQPESLTAQQFRKLAEKVAVRVAA
jgi:CheY-like chemotaxis protein/MinD-like ATPase involved in chromosome partitioning or flagellar assembly